MYFLSLTEGCQLFSLFPVSYSDGLGAFSLTAVWRREEEAVCLNSFPSGSVGVWWHFWTLSCWFLCLFAVEMWEKWSEVCAFDRRVDFFLYVISEVNHISDLCRWCWAWVVNSLRWFPVISNPLSQYHIWGVGKEKCHVPVQQMSAEKRSWLFSLSLLRKASWFI